MYTDLKIEKPKEKQWVLVGVCEKPMNPKVAIYKKGKFYELYEGDAQIGNRLLDLKLTDRVNMSMAGVPEAHLAEWSSKLIAQGYKVAKVDEVETGLAMEKRKRESGQTTGKPQRSNSAVTCGSVGTAASTSCR